MAAMMLVGSIVVGWCHDFEVDGIYYNYNDDGESVSVTAKDETYGWLVYKDVVTIPGEVTCDGRTYRVTAIGKKAFYSCSSLTGVVLPPTVTVIDDNAFARNSNLTTVNIPEAVTTIGAGAFIGDSRLACISLGSNVTHIGSNCFNGCIKLTSITVDALNPVYDSRDSCNAVIEKATNTLLYGCGKTVIPPSVTSIGSRAFAQNTVPGSLVIPSSVQSIGDHAFANSYGLTNLEITDGVRNIGDNAFGHCHSLVSLTLPSTLTSVGTDAFAGCWSLTSIAVDEGNQTYDSRNDCNAIIETATGTLLLGCINTIIPHGVTSIGSSSFAWSKITTVNIPEGVTTIGDYAFDHCYYIDELSLPNTLVSIGYSAFNGAYSGLKNLKLPNSLDSIGGYAFACCSGLTDIDFGQGLKSIGHHAFFACSGLTELNLPPSLLSIGDAAFLSCSGLTSVTIPASVTHVGSAAFQACENLTQMNVDPASVTFDSRDNCNAIIETATGTLVAGCVATVIPGTVTALGDGAFCECIGLNTIDIPESVTAIGAHTFDYCYDLATITLPPHLKSIGNSAFAGCERLICVIIPDEVTSIGDSAFYDCPWLNYLYLGRELGYIGHAAFYGTNLITLTCDAMEPPVIAAEDSFWHYGSFSDATLCVPSPAVNRYSSAQYWSLFPTIVAHGDVDGDGKVTISDVTAMIGHLLANDQSGILVAADMNNDFCVTISDVTTLIGLLLGENSGGGQNPPAPK